MKRVISLLYGRVSELENGLGSSTPNSCDSYCGCASLTGAATPSTSPAHTISDNDFKTLSYDALVPIANSIASKLDTLYKSDARRVTTGLTTPYFLSANSPMLAPTRYALLPTAMGL